MENSQGLSPAQRLRSIFSGSVGNLVEWYDWYVYAAFSLYFAKVFFPQGDLTSQLLNTAAIFAVGFLMRPLGGWLLGRYADRHGRKAALMLSVLLMCARSPVKRRDGQARKSMGEFLRPHVFHKSPSGRPGTALLYCSASF